MGKTRISAAVATYNGERYVRAQMDSILNNLTAADEVVVSDDGSTDATLAILESCRGNGIPVRILKGPGKGIKQNIANALRECRGQYIFLADQDDVWADGKVERVMRYLGRDGCRLVCHDARVMDASLRKTLMPSFFAYRGSKPGFFANLLKNRYMGCCMAFDRRLLQAALPIPDEIEMHDQWLGMLNDINGGKSRFVREPLLYYRRHGANVSDFSHGTPLQMLKKRLVLLRAVFRRKMLQKY